MFALRVCTSCFARSSSCVARKAFLVHVGHAAHDTGRQENSQADELRAEERADCVKDLEGDVGSVGAIGAEHGAHSKDTHALEGLWVERERGVSLEGDETRRVQMHEHQLSIQAAVFPQARVRDERIENARRRVEKEKDLREELGGFAAVSHRVQKRRQHGREEQQRRKGEGRAYHVEGGRVYGALAPRDHHTRHLEQPRLASHKVHV